MSAITYMHLNNVANENKSKILIRSSVLLILFCKKNAISKILNIVIKLNCSGPIAQNVEMAQSKIKKPYQMTYGEIKNFLLLMHKTVPAPQKIIVEARRIILLKVPSS